MDRLLIGEVLKPQGIRGELKIKTYTDEPEDVKKFGTVYIDDVAYKILSFRVGPDGAAYMGLRGIPDRNAAELFFVNIHRIAASLANFNRVSLAVCRG